MKSEEDQVTISRGLLRKLLVHATINFQIMQRSKSEEDQKNAKRIEKDINQASTILESD